MVSEKSRSFPGICGPYAGTEASRGCRLSRNIAVISFPGAAGCGPQTKPAHPWEKYAAFTEPVKKLVAHLPLTDSHGNEQPPAIKNHVSLVFRMRMETPDEKYRLSEVIHELRAGPWKGCAADSE